MSQRPLVQRVASIVYHHSTGEQPPAVTEQTIATVMSNAGFSPSDVRDGIDDAVDQNLLEDVDGHYRTGPEFRYPGE